MATRRMSSAAAAAAALLLLVAGGAQAASPLIARSAMMTVDEVRPGMKGVGKSVFAGTRIENFGVTVIGVLRRVDFGGDVILVKIDSGPPVTKGYGVIAGMSGSPVHIRGKLIGALAYTWPFAKRPVAGITPIAQMLEAFQPGSSPVRQEGALKATQPFVIDGQRIDRATVGETAVPVKAGSGSMSLVPVSTPIMVSGLNSGAMEVLKNALEPLGMTPVSGAGAMSHVNARMVPGAAVGARLMGGDLDVTAVGTVTYVSKDVVLAFGHTMSSLGSADIPLVAAYVHGVMPSAELSFKLASGGQTLGRFTEDRPWCIGGRLGPRAALVRTKITVVDRDRKVTRSYALDVVRNRSLTTALLNAAMVGAIRSVGPPSEGTTRVSFALDADGLPRLVRANTYAMEEGGGLLALLLGPQAAVMSATEELNQILDALQNSEFGEVKLSSLGISVELSKKRRVARLEQVIVDKHKVRPGDEVLVTATLRVADRGRVTRVEKVHIPQNCPPGSVQIGIAGGKSAEWLRSRLDISEPRPESLGQMVTQMLDRPSNDQLVVQMALPTVGMEARGLVFRDLPPAVLDILRSSSGTKLRPLRDFVERRETTEWVVSGYSVITLVVEGDERDKGGRPPSPQRGLMFEEMGPGLAGLFSGFGMSTKVMASMGALADDSIIGDDDVSMPSWDDVSLVGETELVSPAATGEPSTSTPQRGEAVGRVASLWRLSTDKDLLPGKAEGVGVVSNGGLVLAPKPTVLGQAASQCLWPIAAGLDGSVYAGSWSDGKLWKITLDGRLSAALETSDAAVQAVTVGKDGVTFAASLPSGTIYRIAPGQKAAVLCKLSAPVIWALEATASGTLWAATGPEGNLYRITADGKASVAFTAADRHIMALAVGGDGTLYLATAPLGKVYAIGPDGAARSVFEIEKSSAQSIAVDAGGNIYVGTSPDGRVLRISKDGAVREMLRTKGKHVTALRVGADGVVYAAAGPEASLYAIYPDQTWAQIYDSKSAYMAGMAADQAGAIYLTAADTGQVVKLDSTSARTGRYISPVRDAGASARWGAARWQSSTPDGSKVAILTRSGETAHPDSTWSDWQPVLPASNALISSPTHRFLQCRVDMESTGPAVPRLESVEFSYLPANRAPEITLSAPKGGEIWAGKKTVRWSGRDPDNDTLTYDVFWSSDNGNVWTRIEAPVKPEVQKEKPKEEPAAKSAKSPPALDAESGEAPKGKPVPAKPAARDSAKPTMVRADELGFDPQDDDPMQMSGGFGSGTGMDGDERGEEDAAKSGSDQRPSPSTGSGAVVTTSLEWDTTKGGDGVYVIKVVGSDRVANPMDARQGEAISRPFTVDSTPPELIVDRTRKDTDPPPADVQGHDRTTYITSAEFKTDTGPWMAAVAKDGIFDEPSEVILLDAARVPAGSHQIEIRARDAAGNAASATLKYTK